jgi:site-specific recombinase XerD
LTDLVESTRRASVKRRAVNTRRAYDSDWRAFTAWCAEVKLTALPAQPETLALYIQALAKAGKAAATVKRAVATISQAHKGAGLDSPAANPQVKTVLVNTCRDIGVSQKQARPLLPEHIRAGLYGHPAATLRDYRDRAVVGIGFCGGFRRSEIVGLDVEDLEFEPRGVVILLGRSKTDQEGHGWRKAIPNGQSDETCPVKALRAWLEQAKILSGPIFREITVNGVLTERRLSDHAVDRLVKRVAKRAGQPAEKYSGHSLRAGFVTQAHLMGKSDDRIMDMTGHRSLKTLRGYKRIADLFVNNAAEGIGL